MKRQQLASNRDASLWQGVVQLQGNLPASAARALLRLQFSERDHARMEHLSTKARAGSLSESEQSELDNFERLGCVLDIVHSKARLALKKRPNKAS